MATNKRDDELVTQEVTTQTPTAPSGSIGQRLTLERYLKLKQDYQFSLEKLDRLVSGRETATFSGVDYTQYEIANLRRDLNWYEQFMEQNYRDIASVLPPRPQTVPFFSKPIDVRDTIPASPISGKKTTQSGLQPHKDRGQPTSVIIRPILKIQ